MGSAYEAASIQGMPDPAYLVVARVHGVAARTADLAEAAHRLAAACRAEDGCLAFDVLAEPDSRSELVLVSEWRTEADMRAHFASEAYAGYSSAVTDLLTRPSDVDIHRVAATLHPIADLSTEPQRAS
jgi:quinol monooxygenase YgiN